MIAFELRPGDSLRALPFVLTAALLAASPLAAQTVSLSDTGAISGRVLAADAAIPLAHATVLLTPVRPNGPTPDAVSHAPTRATITGRDGTYRFPDVSVGVYRLTIKRIGYKPASLEVQLRQSSPVTVSAVLELAPIYLEPVAVRTTVDRYRRSEANDAELDLSRVGLERWRQSAFLESDVRILDHRDVLDAITLAEPDPIRALQRLPGVATRDDWTAEAWVRGAPWGQTRIYFDGLPLFNPLHAGGLTSAINPDVIGSVTFFPGVRSVALGEGSAGIVSLTSRSAGASGGLNGNAGMSLLGGGLTLGRRFGDGRVGALVGARRSALPVPVTGDLEPAAAGGGELELPDNYSDVVGRVDLDLGRRVRVEMSGLWEQDWIEDGLENGPAGNTFAWGNAAGRITMDADLSSDHRTRHTVGVSHFGVEVEQTRPALRIDRFNGPRRSPTQPNSEGHVLYVSAAGEIGSAGFPSRSRAWRVGYQLTHQRSRYRGAPATPYPVQTVRGELELERALNVGAVWGEMRWMLLPGFVVQGGLRVEGSEALRSTAGARVAPQLSIRHGLSSRLSFSLAAGRTYQYLQPFAPVGLSVGPGLPISHAWLLAGGDVPPLRTDLATGGVELWVGDRWLASANVYLRGVTGVALVDPTPGPIAERTATVIGETTSRGVEATIRRLAGRWTIAFGYGYGRSDIDAAGLRFPAPTDRRHTLDITSRWRPPAGVGGGRLVFGGALTAASGVPYTRIFPGRLECDQARDLCVALVPDLQGSPSLARTPWYASVDFSIDWTRRWSAWELGAFVQLLNAFDRDNAVTYTVDRDGPCARRTVDAPQCGLDSDQFLSGRARMAVVGMRFAF